MQEGPRISPSSHRRGPRRLSAHRFGIDRHWAATPTNWGPRNPSKGLMLTYGPTRNNGQRFGDRRRSRATSPRRRATYGGDDNVLVSHGTKEAVKVTGEHQQLTKNLAKAMVQPETPQARMATYVRRARRQAAVDTTTSAVSGQR